MSRLRSLIAELRLRRPGDVAYRARMAIQGRTGALERRFAASPPDPETFLSSLSPGIASTMSEFVRHFDTRSSPRFVFDETDARFIAARAPRQDRSTLISAAEDVLAGRFRLLGVDIDLGLVDGEGLIDWHAALHREGHWPRVHWAQIPYRSLDHLGDIKVPWELARHQYLPILGLAWRETGDDRYAVGAARILRSFIAQNPPEVGIHYLSNMELGLRCISWLWTLYLLRPARGFDADTRGLLHIHVHRMAAHLNENLAFTAATGPNNHLIGDAASLLIVSVLYPELREAARWKERAESMLLKGLAKQVRPDGMHFEGSFGYHRFVMEFVWTVVALLDCNSTAPPSMLQALERMTIPLVVGRCPDGELLRTNDEDDGSALPLSLSAPEAAAALLAVGAAWFRRADWKAAATAFGDPPAAACWMLGKDGLERYDSLLTSDDPSDSVLPAAGLFVARTGCATRQDMVFVDNHPDPFPDSGHNHASLLQVQLWLEGRSVLVDSGTGRYNGGQPYRNALRSTRSHNTLILNGRGQAEPSRNFGWTSRADPSRSEWSRGDRGHRMGEWALFDGDHRCFPRTIHRRTVLWLPARQCLVARDELSGGTYRRSIEQNWHIAPDLDVSRTQGPVASFIIGDKGGQPIAYLHLPGATGDEIVVVRGSEDNPWACFSPRYGEIVPKSVVSRRWAGVGCSVRYTVVVGARSAAKWGIPEVESSDDAFFVRNLGFGVALKESRAVIVDSGPSELGAASEIAREALS